MLVLMRYWESFTGFDLSGTTSGRRPVADTSRRLVIRDWSETGQLLRVTATRFYPRQSAVVLSDLILFGLKWVLAYV